jgi:hypothetical protein
VDGLASPYTGLWLIAVCWGSRFVLPRRCLSGGGSFLGCRYQRVALTSFGTYS